MRAIATISRTVVTTAPWRRGWSRVARPVAARELDRIVVPAVAEPDVAEQAVRAAERIGHADDPQRDRDVLRGRQGRNQVIGLEDVAERVSAESRERVLVELGDLDAGDGDRARARTVETRDEPQQSRFPASGGSGDRADLARGDVERDAVEHRARSSAA